MIDARKVAAGLDPEVRIALTTMVAHMETSDFRQRVGLGPAPSSSRLDPSVLPRLEALGLFTTSGRRVTPASENVGIVVSTVFTITPLGREVAAMLSASEAKP